MLEAFVPVLFVLGLAMLVVFLIRITEQRYEKLMTERLITLEDIRNASAAVKRCWDAQVPHLRALQTAKCREDYVDALQRLSAVKSKKAAAIERQLHLESLMRQQVQYAQLYHKDPSSTSSAGPSISDTTMNAIRHRTTAVQPTPIET